MGYRLEAYSLQELSRISMPGVVVPGLFWCVPVGSWTYAGPFHRGGGTLESWWEWFTARDTLCNEIGLLLTNPRKRPGRASGHVDFEPLQAVLTELMPPGCDRFLGSRGSFVEQQALLVLSAAYPQPGWGVLLDCGSAEAFEEVVKQALAGAGRGEAAPDLRPITAARDLHRRRAEHEEEEPNPPDDLRNAGELLTAIQAHESAGDKAREAVACFESRDFDTGARLLKDAADAARSTDLQDDDVARWAELSRQGSLVLSASGLSDIQGIPGYERLGELCDMILVAKQSQSKVLKGVTDNSLKRAVGACVSLRERGIADTTEGCTAWVRQSLEPLAGKIVESLRHELTRLESQLVTLRGRKAHAEEEWRRRRAVWLEKDRRIRAACQAAAEEAAAALWELGPSFLVELERVCRRRDIPARSVSWDPARMVGWKVAVSGIPLKATDIWSMARGMAPEVSRPAADGEADGSYFTDYVHHIAMAKADGTPYSVTRDLLARLLPSQLERLVVAHGGKVQDETLGDASALAGQALEVLGWRKPDGATEQGLASCLGEDATGKVSIKNVRDRRDLRNVVESFCKDFIDTVVQVLGYDERRLWQEVRHCHPLYRSRHGRDDWNAELSKLMVGPAAMICEALVPLAFPSRLPDVNTFIDTLKRLGKVLNEPNHHNSGQASTNQPVVDVAELVKSLLGSAHALVGEMPWHLDASAVYGEQPKVLSGMAWSHSSPITRQIRVMDWLNAAPGRSLTLWNKTRRNPIITDPVFIRRPGAG